jgi:hypothetical protein
MVGLVSKISKGTRMDQIYISKERVPGFELGTSVLIKPILEKKKINPFYYNVNNIEPIKNIIIEEILNYFEGLENVIITGSFLEKSFNFEDIDLILLTDKKIKNKYIEEHFKDSLGINTHVIPMDFKVLLKGLDTDPLFQMMLSKFVSKKRIIFKIKNKINYKLLDLHLLKSELLIKNFYFLTGREKYKFVRNLFAIILFLDEKIISPESIDEEINRYFGNDSVRNIKENLVDKNFLERYEKLYLGTFKRIMNGVNNGPKQKQTD